MTKPALPSHLKSVVTALRRPVSWLLLGLGFSASLPFLLVGSTLGYWLRPAGVSLTVIGYLTSVGLLYGLKFLWAPWMDKARLPLLYRWLGQRRSYMLLSQVCAATGILAMAIIGPKVHIGWFVAAALFVAFSAASQEIAIDAWRVEETKDDTDQALNPSLYNFGYRTGILITSSAILFLANAIDWPHAYALMALCLVAGMIATLCAPRTDNELRHIRDVGSARELFIAPFVSFFREHAGTAGWVLLLIALYRLPDYVIGPVAGPMYQDSGIAPAAIATLRGAAGLIGYGGIALGGACVLWLGLERAFWIGALTCPLTKLGFAWIALAHGNLYVFTGVLVADDLSNGIAETAIIAFMTRLTGKDHTLTHYALMYSVMAFTGKFLKMFSGQIVDNLTPHMGLFVAYAAFFIGSAIVGVPCLILCWHLRRKGIFSTPPAATNIS